MATGCGKAPVIAEHIRMALEFDPCPIWQSLIQKELVHKTMIHSGSNAFVRRDLFLA